MSRPWHLEDSREQSPYPLLLTPAPCAWNLTGTWYMICWIFLCKKILFIYEGQFLKETSSQWQKWFLVWKTSWPWLLKGVLFTFLQGLGQRISNLTTTKREKGAKMKTVRLLAKALAAKEVEIAGERLADKSRQRLYWKEGGEKKRHMHFKFHLFNTVPINVLSRC